MCVARPHCLHVDVAQHKSILQKCFAEHHSSVPNVLPCVGFSGSENPNSGKSAVLVAAGKDRSVRTPGRLVL